NADLAVALSRMRISAGEERPLAPHGQPEHRADGEVPVVHVPASLHGRKRQMDARDVGTGTQRSEEGLERDLHAAAQNCAHAVPEVPRLEVTVGKVVGEEAEAGEYDGPARLPRLQHGDLVLHCVLGVSDLYGRCTGREVVRG